MLREEKGVYCTASSSLLHSNQKRRTWRGVDVRLSPASLAAALKYTGLPESFELFHQLSSLSFCAAGARTQLAKHGALQGAHPGATAAALCGPLCAPSRLPLADSNNTVELEAAPCASRVDAPCASQALLALLKQATPVSVLAMHLRSGQARGVCVCSWYCAWQMVTL